jgi:RNA polymerase sigma factor (sigma-70 family)
MTAEQEKRISADIEREGPRLRNFIRARVRDAAEAEDILQDVLFELVESYRLMRPIEQVGGWLFRVARNRIADFFRKKRPVALDDLPRASADEGETLLDLLPSPAAGPEAAFARNVLIEELEAALDELPAEQREAFIAHEIEGVSFKELAVRTGVRTSTLFARKRYAVLHLRERLRDIYDEMIQTEE